MSAPHIAFASSAITSTSAAPASASAPTPIPTSTSTSTSASANSSSLSSSSSQRANRLASAFAARTASLRSAAKRGPGAGHRLHSLTPAAASTSTAAATPDLAALGPLPLPPPPPATANQPPPSSPITVSNAVLDSITHPSRHQFPQSPPLSSSHSHPQFTNPQYDDDEDTQPAKPSLPFFGQAHIISAFVDADADDRSGSSPPVRPPFSTRTSSLLPPARVVARTVHRGPNSTTANANSAVSDRAASQSHSQSHSQSQSHSHSQSHSQSPPQSLPQPLPQPPTQDRFLVPTNAPVTVASAFSSAATAASRPAPPDSLPPLPHPPAASSSSASDYYPHNHSRQHSRPSSALSAALNQSDRLDRHDRSDRLDTWSISTGSSGASLANTGVADHPLVKRHHRATSYSRHLSIDSIGPQAGGRAPAPTALYNPSSNPANSAVHSTPRKLQKSRPTTAANETPNSASGSPLHKSPARARAASSALRIPPPASLPPIISLTSLEQDVQGETSFFGGSGGSGDFGLGIFQLGSRASAQPKRRPLIRRLSSEDNTHSFYLGDAHDDGIVRSASSLATQTAPDVTDRHDKQDFKYLKALPLPPTQTRTHSRDPSPGATMQYSHEGTSSPRAGHSRHRPRNGDTQNGGSTDSTASNRDRPRKPPSQRAMLSRALQKANAAVQLDNASNVEEAREAYMEACSLLQQVLERTPGDDDKRKLEAIRVTYTARIEELDQLAGAQQHSNAASGTPAQNNDEADADDGGDHSDVHGALHNQETEEEEEDDGAVFNQARTGSTEPRFIPSYSVPLSTSSPRLLQSAFATNTAAPEQTRPGASLLSEQYTLQSSRSPRQDFVAPNNAPTATHPAKTNHYYHAPGTNGSTLQPPNQYMPPPLSPRRLASSASFDDPIGGGAFGSNLAPQHAQGSGTHKRSTSFESVSWLDPINESDSSTASSVHSRSSSNGIRRKHIRAASGETEAEFDAALDDAIEAAYDDSYDQPEQQLQPQMPLGAHGYFGHTTDDVQISQAMRRVELAKERVRETEREAMALNRQMQMRQQQQQQQHMMDDDDDMPDFIDADDDSEDEERILEEITHGLAMEEFSFGLELNQSDVQSRPNRPRIDSRAQSIRNPHTASTSLSSTTAPMAMATLPPTQALPQLPTSQPARSSPSQTVRRRRLSGNLKQLKIETPEQPGRGVFVQQRQAVPAGSTGPAGHAGPAGPGAALTESPQLAGLPPPPPLPLPRPGSRPGSRPASRPGSRPGSRQAPTQPTHPTLSPGGGTMFLGASPVEAAMPPPNFPPPTPPAAVGATATGGLRKNISSSSLKSLRTRNMSHTTLDGSFEAHPGTPVSAHFLNASSSVASRIPELLALPTPFAPPSAFKDRMVNTPSGVGGLHLLESDFHSPTTPGSPNLLASDGPITLEPCPTDTLLRPFWLMRCLYQTLVHPRGGYLTNRLFVPSDAWKVRGVRLKHVDEKIANCDYLTAALLKLATVDTCDADDLLDEMQSLEAVLEQAQAALSRKLGNEVGVQSTASLFKEASASTNVASGSGAGGDAGENGVSGNGTGRSGSASAGSGGGSGSSSSRSFSWRRLRSKNSSAGLNTGFSNVSGTTNSTDGSGASRKESVSAADGAKDSVPLASLPMTAQPIRRPAKRDIASARFTGPNAAYMSSLARLFDAAQAVDQVARQVEDPGLRHADKTQVGLELCTRHAAEFFAFYICRFVLSDVSLLLEKFIKRGSEWVLA